MHFTNLIPVECFGKFSNCEKRINIEDDKSTAINYKCDVECPVYINWLGKNKIYRYYVVSSLENGKYKTIYGEYDNYEEAKEKFLNIEKLLFNKNKVDFVGIIKDSNNNPLSHLKI